MGLVRAVGEEAVALAGRSLYRPAGLGVLDKGEYAEKFAADLFITKGLMRQMAGALEAAAVYLAKAKSLGGLGQVLTTALTTVSVASKIGGTIKNALASGKEEAKAKNAAAGLQRFKDNQLKTAQEAYAQLTTALTDRGIPFTDNASEPFFAQLKEQLGGWPDPSKAPIGVLKFAKHFDKSVVTKPYRPIIDRFSQMMAAAATEINATPVTQQTLAPGARQPDTGPVQNSTQAAAPAAAEQGAGKWLLPAGAALLALKVFGG
jgi:hypothetical protein